MKTPDGKEFGTANAAKPLAAAAGAAGAAAVFLLRTTGKFIATSWRLAAALDSALWRALKLVAHKGFGAATLASGWTLSACRSLLLWIPTRTGRAYSSVSGVFLIIAGLWIIDELRAGPANDAGAQFLVRPPVDEEDPILARIEGRYVHLSEIEAAARAGGFLRASETLTPQTAFQRKLVETYVEQRLLARAALSTGLQRQPRVMRRVNAARDRVLAASFMETRLQEVVKSEAVRQLYDAAVPVTRLGDEVRARHILVETGAQAEEIIALLRGGADFGALARERSIDRATAPLGGEVGWFTRAMMEPVFANAAFSAKPDEIAPPFQTDFGWHVLEVQARRSTREVPFSQVEDDIREHLRLRTINATLIELEEKNQVVYFRPEEPDIEIPPPPELRASPPDGAGVAGEEDTFN